MNTTGTFGWVPGTVQLALFAVVMLISAWRMLRGGVSARPDDAPHLMAVVAGGFGVGALSGLVGGGGGFLIVPALVLLAGVPMANAVGTSLAVIALNAFTGFAKYLGVLERQSLELDWSVLLAVAAFGVRFDPARLRRRAVNTATAALLLGLPLLVGQAWARWDYTRTRDVYAQQIIDALRTYYEKEATYPESLDQLVETGLLAAIPKPQIGFPFPGSDDSAFTYQGFGTSYLLEFSAPRWVQCAYNPPYSDEDAVEDDGDAPDVAQGGDAAAAEPDEADLGDGAWSCPSKPPELW